MKKTEKKESNIKHLSRLRKAPFKIKENGNYKNEFILAHNAIIDIKKTYLSKPNIPFGKEKIIIKNISVKKIKKIADNYFEKLQNT